MKKRNNITDYLKIFFIRFLGGFKGIFFIFAIGVGLFLHFYTQNIINQLRIETRYLVQIYAQMHASVANTSNSNLRFIFEEVIQRKDLPIIQTDAEKKPIAWKGISVDPTDTSPEATSKVKNILKGFEQSSEPIPVKYEDTLFGYLYYGDSTLINQLKWLPYVEVGIVGIFIMIGFIGYANIKRSEQRNIWVGMARETAHQLGTPLSSLMGWVEVMRTRKKIDMPEIIQEMNQDLKRLQRVTQRFSLISSKPDLKKVNLSLLLSEMIKYIRKQTPKIGGRSITINEDYQTITDIRINYDLFSWVIENLLKNSLDAINKEEGIINVRLFTNSKNKIFIEIEDNGKGIDSSHLSCVFKPGYSTKKRGWGLGLSLAKRIIKDYHGGKLYVKESKPDKGTIMRIELNTT
ncbi:MAG: HAMP domain-containing sensor histidine kinase [bacterium]